VNRCDLPVRRSQDNQSASTVSLSSELVPDIGHGIALHPSANISFTMRSINGP
jgi:hypothetical protein